MYSLEVHSMIQEEVEVSNTYPFMQFELHPSVLISYENPSGHSKGLLVR